MVKKIGRGACPGLVWSLLDFQKIVKQWQASQNCRPNGRLFLASLKVVVAVVKKMVVVFFVSLAVCAKNGVFRSPPKCSLCFAVSEKTTAVSRCQSVVSVSLCACLSPRRHTHSRKRCTGQSAQRVKKKLFGDHVRCQRNDTPARRNQATTMFLQKCGHPQRPCFDHFLSIGHTPTEKAFSAHFQISVTFHATLNVAPIRAKSPPRRVIRKEWETMIRIIPRRGGKREKARSMEEGHNEIFDPRSTASSTRSRSDCVASCSGCSIWFTKSRPQKVSN